MRNFVCSRVAVLALALFAALNAGAADTLNWNTNQNRVSADIQSVELRRLLEGISQLAGWQVYLEANTTRNVSAKFSDLPPGDALRLLLGNLNFAVVPQTNARSRLYVFRTVQQNATQLIQPGDLKSGADRAAKAIPNQLVVTLKPGAKIESIACLQGAKITGRIEALNIYRVEFENETATQSARECLSRNADVASVDSNFPVDQPLPTQALNNLSAPDFSLKPKEPGSDCRVIIGLIDTRVRSLGNALDAFLMPSISVAGEASATDHLTHGPAMAETILRSLQSASGGTTSAKVLSVDVYGDSPTTSTYDVAAGIYSAITNKANIINLSLGSSGDSTMLHNLIQDASKQGVIFFGAAGNEPVTTPVYPAAYPEVIAVTAGDRPGQIANYANRGSFVDIMAPGTSLVPFNGQSYAVSGTSTAAAFASGFAAGLADSSQNCPDQVVSIIRSKLGVTLSGQ